LWRIATIETLSVGLVIASIHERRGEFGKERNRREALGGRTGRWRDRTAPSKE
jgi:hypothetical protein